MTGRMIAMINTMLGWLVRRGGRVTVGSGSAVRWWGLRADRHGGRFAIGRDSIVRCRIDFNSLRGEVLVGDRCCLGVATSGRAERQVAESITTTRLRLSAALANAFGQCLRCGWNSLRLNL